MGPERAPEGSGELGVGGRWQCGPRSCAAPPATGAKLLVARCGILVLIESRGRRRRAASILAGVSWPLSPSLSAHRLCMQDTHHTQIHLGANLEPLCLAHTLSAMVPLAAGNCSTVNTPAPTFQIVRSQRGSRVCSPFLAVRHPSGGCTRLPLALRAMPPPGGGALGPFWTEASMHRGGTAAHRLKHPRRTPHNRG